MPTLFLIEDNAPLRKSTIVAEDDQNSTMLAGKLLQSLGNRDLAVIPRKV